MKNTFVLVFEHGNEEPIAVFPSNELTDNLSLYKFINIDDRKKIDNSFLVKQKNRINMDSHLLTLLIFFAKSVYRCTQIHT